MNCQNTAFIAISAFTNPFSASIHFPLFSRLFLLSAIPGYIAWASLEGCADVITLMYASLALCVAQVTQGATQALAQRSRVPPGTSLAGFAVVTFGALMGLISLYNFGEFTHPLLAPRPTPRPVRGVVLETAPYGANCEAAQGNATRDSCAQSGVIGGVAVERGSFLWGRTRSQYWDMRANRGMSAAIVVNATYGAGILSEASKAREET